MATTIFLVNPQTFPSSTSYLLDTYTAAAAYSLRQLKTGVTNVVRVRRSSDNAESDFTADEITDGTLASFCSGTDGFVTTLYEQSGSGKANFTQTTSANQPKLVSSGSVLVNGSGQPYLDFDGSNDSIGASGMFANSVSNVWSFSVKNSQNFDIVRSHGLTTWSWEVLTVNGALNDSHRVTNTTPTTYTSTVGTISTGQALLTSEYARGGNVRVYLNGTGATAATAAATDLRGSDVLDVGRTAASGYRAMQFQEFILFNSDESANRTAIENDINENYDLYWNGQNTGLLDTYSASAAYSLRNLNSSYTGALVRVRRSSDNAERDIYGTWNGNLNTSALENFCSGTDGFVVTWYDQSGNGNDVTQATAGSQPKLVSSGSVITTNSLASVEFDGSTDFLTGGTNSSTSGFLFMVQESITGSIPTISVANPSINTQWIAWKNSNIASRNYAVSVGVDSVNDTYGTTSTTNTQSLATIKSSGTAYSMWTNGNSESLTVIGANNGKWFGDYPSYNLTIGSLQRNSKIYYNQRTQEVILFDTDESSNRTAIESDINTYYSIY